MALDPQARALLDQLAALGAPPLHEQTPEVARATMAAGYALRPPGEDVDRVENLAIPGPNGPIPLRIYAPQSSRALPIVVYYHGGGWVIGDLDYQDTACRYIANHTPACVVSVDYRLAPEHKFPAPFDDSYTALEWVAANAPSIGGDAGRIAVAGDSAGGNLAAAVAIKARDAGGPALAHQLLVYPVTNYSYDTPSYSENAEGYLLTRDAMRWFWDHYLNTAGEGADVRASPLRVADAAGLPSATVITAGFDPLRDEGRAYAERLRAAGVPVRHSNYESMIHGFYALAHVLEEGRRAHDESVGVLQAAFGLVPA
jgi:acetyl esterase